MQSTGKENLIPTIDIDVSKLPSRGLTYPKGAKLKYRTYTFGEIRNASTSSFDIVAGLKRTLSGLICDFDVYNLTVNDALYLGILRKISTFHGIDIEIPFVCTKCGSGEKGTINEKSLAFNDIDEYVEALPLEVTLKGKQLQIAPTTVRQFIELKEGRYNNFLINGKIDETVFYATWVKNQGFEESYKMISGLVKDEDFELMEELNSLLKHELKRIPLKCSKPECGHVNNIKLEGREALLRPFRNGRSSARNRIRFSGKASHQPSGDGSTGVQQGNAAQ